jgi:hypothetical protein
MLKFVKLWTDETLDSGIRKNLAPDERCMFYEFLILAGKSKREGYLEYSETRPMTIEDISLRLRTNEELVTRAISKCIEQQCLELRDETYYITNWNKYQTSPARRAEEYKKRREHIESKKAESGITWARNNPELAKIAAEQVLVKKAELDDKLKDMAETQNGIDAIYDKARGSK